MTRRYNPHRQMLEEFILDQIPVREVVLFQRLRGVPYTEWLKAFNQLLHDGCVTYVGDTIVAGDGVRVPWEVLVHPVQ
jgi:hypothetical protein